MNLKKLLLLVVSLICISLSSQTAFAHSLLMGTIQFPQSLSTVPTIRVYCAGKIIPCSVDQKTKTLTFSIPKYAQQHHFNLVITEKVRFGFSPTKYEDKPANTPSYLKLEQKQPYLYYSLLLTPEFTESESAQLTYRWRIRPESLSTERKIPDDAIIVCCDANWIAGIDSSNSFEFPTIEIKPDLLELAGSQEKLREASARLMLAALDSDTMHALATPQEMKQDKNRITIAAPTA